jgi:hypothetical protein
MCDRPSQRHLPDTTQHSQATNIHAASGIRTRNLIKRDSAEPRLRQRVHFYRPKEFSQINPLTPNDIQKRRAVCTLKIKIPH